MRKWISNECIRRGVQNALIVSHGGMLRVAFETSLFE